MLGRAASAGEVDGWLAITGALDNVEGRRALALEFVRSPEGRARTIENAYVQLLHRASDPGGKAAYLEAMQNGLVEGVLAVELLVSSEYQQRCAG